MLEELKERERETIDYVILFLSKNIDYVIL